MEKKMTKIIGDLIITKENAKNYKNITEVTGSVDIIENATLNAPKIFFSKNKAKIKNAEYDVLRHDGLMFLSSHKRTSKGIIINDGYLELSISEGEPLLKSGFLVEKDNFFAHGENLKKAISDLQFKIVSDKLKKEPIQKDTLMTVKHYRLITGSCDFGCRQWMESNGIEFDIIDGETVEKNPVKAVDLLPMLKKSNAYGLDKILSLIDWE